ncbi:MAG: hypothetical protein ACTSSE_17855, partial [Candidatus Thorarchaeota archaeon]
MVVVTGWQMIEGSLPPRLRSALNELERYLVERVHQSKCKSLWFLKPRSDEKTSEVYRSRCFRPFRDASPHREVVTDIVWNLPIRPYTSIQTTPMLDDLRVIVHQTKDSVNTELVEIPYLKDWSSRFWSQRSKRGKKSARTTGKGRPLLSAQDIQVSPQFSIEFIDASIDLIPWIHNLWPKRFKKKQSAVKYRFDVKSIKLYGNPSPRSGIMSRIEYRPPLKKSRGGRGYVPTQSLIPKMKITHPRHYRRYRKKKRKKPNKQSYRAPNEALLKFKCLREQTARNV